MAGSKINNFSIGDSNIQSVMLTLDKAYKGLHQVSLTNYNTTAESQIAAGSVVENNGALYTFNSNESITGSPSGGTVYIRLVPSGDTITAEYTNTAPTWSDSKQGWYGTGGDANKRYIEVVFVKSSSEWLKRSFARRRDENIIKERSHSIAYRDTAQSFTGSTGFIVLFNKKTIDTNTEHDTATGIFTAKRSGLYFIKYRFTLNISNLGAYPFVQSSIRIADNIIFRGHVAYSTGIHVFQGSIIHTVARGETISIIVGQSSAAVSALDDLFSVACLFEVVEL